MKKIDLGQVVTILANVGVIGGLIFVGFQLRQDREIARAALRQQIVEQDMYWAELVEQNSDVWVKGLVGDPLSSAEQAEFNAMARALETHRWTAYMQAQGILAFDPSRLVRQWARDLHQNPGLRTWWQAYLTELQHINPSPISPWTDQVEIELGRLASIEGATEN